MFYLCLKIPNMQYSGLYMYYIQTAPDKRTIIVGWNYFNFLYFSLESYEYVEKIVDSETPVGRARTNLAQKLQSTRPEPRLEKSEKS